MKKIFFIVYVCFSATLLFIWVYFYSMNIRDSKHGNEEVFLEVKMHRVVDGDTLIVEKRGKEQRVRLIGIDAPERASKNKDAECLAHEATIFLKKELGEHRKIFLFFDKNVPKYDRFGRLLAYVFLSDGRTDINKNMIESGLAHEYTFQGQNYRYRSIYRQTQKKAQEKNKGIWSEYCLYKKK